MANTAELLGLKLSDVQNLMSPEFDAVANSIVKESANLDAETTAAMTRASQFQPVSNVQPVYEARQVSPNSLRAGAVTNAMDFSDLDCSNYKAPEDPKLQPLPEITPDMVKSSQLPSYLKESFLNTPPQTIQNAPEAIDTFAETLKEKFGIKEQVAQNNAQQPVQKSAPVNNKPTYTQRVQQLRESTQKGNTCADSDIQELIKEEMNVVYQKLRKDLVNVANQIVKGINSSNLSTIKLGDTLRFVDSDGNVFDAKLEYKGKAKRK